MNNEYKNNYDDNRKQVKGMTNKQHFSYKGYTGSIDFSTEDKCLFGKVQMIQDLIMYDGKTLEELKLSFESAVDEYLEMCVNQKDWDSEIKRCNISFHREVRK